MSSSNSLQSLELIMISFSSRRDIHGPWGSGEGIPIPSSQTLQRASGKGLRGEQARQGAQGLPCSQALSEIRTLSYVGAAFTFNRKRRNSFKDVS